MVEGDLQVHHAAYGDSVVDNRRTLDDGFGGEYRCLRVIDDRYRDHTSQSTRVVDGEGATGDIFGPEIAGPRPPYCVIYLPGEAQSIQLVGVVDDRHDEGVFEVHRNPEVYLLAQDDPVPVPHGVQDRVLLEALCNRLRDKR